MKKDKELREILGECGLDTPDEEEIQKAMGLIKALYKPLEKEELKKILIGKVIVGEGITEQLTVSTRTLGLFADAIINARGVSDV